MEMFTKLGEQFKWDPLIVQWMTGDEGLQAASLADFLHAAATEAEAGELAKAACKAVKLENTFLWVSRVRQAWVSLKSAEEEATRVKRKGTDEQDLDSMLSQLGLDNLDAKFFQRYKMTWPPEIAPGDLLVSRISKELSKRLLSVREVFKVRTQAMQGRTAAKRARMTDEVVVVLDQPEEVEMAHDLSHYLMGLHTLMIAYAKAGVEVREGAPTAEPKGTDTTKVVECPLDVAMRYYYRAQVRAAQGATLGWIQRQDEADRNVWVDKYRNGTSTLGEVMQQVFDTRMAMWEHRAAALPAPPPPPAAADSKRGRRPQKQNPQQQQQKQQTQIGKLATQFSDGTKFCGAYQKGKCNRSNCNFKHACAVVLSKTGRVCGQNHPGNKCPGRR